jgi:hypothetical protein
MFATKERSMKTEIASRSDPELRRRVYPRYDDQDVLPPRKRRHSFRNLVVFAAIALILAAALGVYQRIAGQPQSASSQPGQTVYDQATVTPGQLHLTYKVQYAYRVYTAQDSATQTDPNIQDCAFLIFGCKPASATETVKITAFMEAGIDYDANPPKLAFGPGKTVTVTVSTPTLLNFGVLKTDLSSSSTKYTVDESVINGLITRVTQAALAKAHDTQLLETAKENAMTKIKQDAAAYGLKATVVLTS